ncbi:single-stranded DNA-binding protein [Streptomyces zagrosensis]|uniref:Single-strand DNA-binding protein n=1 Tax=Streptomyces zagrosensis TaxID=1042984 RepID=A0A7W9Q7D4_9ACTN|nr:single-stranded DNA-binding protein [Streptomyces zagrosensis]MBB5934988.1 single-strand DNA-binding protein [Streptomyces zagrosensis]
MNETELTVVGNAATRPDYKETAAGVPVVRFRLAVTARRWERERAQWIDSGTSFYTVRAWRALAANVAASVAIGEPLVVRGRLRIQEQERDGKWWFSADLDAFAIGHDLSRGTSAFRRVSQVKKSSPASAESSTPATPTRVESFTEAGLGGDEREAVREIAAMGSTRP